MTRNPGRIIFGICISILQQIFFMKKMIKRAFLFFWIICLFVFLFSCNQNSASVDNKLLDQSGMDSTVRPQDDFFHYVNGGWIKKTEIPASEATWGAGAILYQNTTQNLKNLIDSCAKLNAAKGTNEQKVGDFYTSAMDSAGIEKKGFSPLETDIRRIASLQSPKDILHEVALEYNLGISALINFYANQDDKNSEQVVAHFDQGGLGLPNKDYYTKKDSAMVGIRNAYLNYIAKIFTLSGDSARAKQSAASVMKIENALAMASKTPVELRDPEANYHKIGIAELEKQAP